MDKRQYQPVPPLLPAPHRLVAGLVLAGCAVFTAAAGVVSARDTPNGDILDQPIDSWTADHLGTHPQALQLVAHLGDAIPVAAMTAALILVCLAVRRVNGAVLAAISVPAAAVLAERVLKHVVNQYYPSGRTTGAFSLIAVAAVLLTDPPRAATRPAVRIAILVAAVLIGCAVGMATIGLGYHRFTDVVGGATSGTAVVLAATFLIDLPAIRRLLAIAGRRPRLAEEKP